MNYDSLYDAFKVAEEENNRQKFAYFMQGFEYGIVNDLDKYYANNDEKYQTLVNNVKKYGFKVLRNSEGKHKIV